MSKLGINDVTKYVEDNIGVFHQKRIESLDNLKLSQVLRRKNPYLFKAKYVLSANDLVKGIVDAHISSSEEGIFGDWLEGLAIFINEKVYSGKKSSAQGIDLEFDKEGQKIPCCHQIRAQLGQQQPNQKNGFGLQKRQKDTADKWVEHGGNRCQRLLLRCR